jgi:hypothetical protein
VAPPLPRNLWTPDGRPGGPLVKVGLTMIRLGSIFLKNYCCDPFKKHKLVVRGNVKIDLKFSDSVFELKSDLRLIPGKVLCPRCYIQVTSNKNLGPQSPRNEENVQPDSLNDDDSTLFSVERVITPRRVIIVLSSASIISPVSDINRSNSE